MSAGTEIRFTVDALDASDLTKALDHYARVCRIHEQWIDSMRVEKMRERIAEAILAAVDRDRELPGKEVRVN